MRIIMFTRENDATSVLPATSFLDSQVECLPPIPSSYAEVDSADVVMIDARGDLTRARAQYRYRSPVNLGHGGQPQLAVNVVTPPPWV